MAVDVAVAVKVAIRALVGVGVTEGVGATMERSGQEQPKVIAEVNNAEATAIPRPPVSPDTRVVKVRQQDASV